MLEPVLGILLAVPDVPAVVLVPLEVEPDALLPGLAFVRMNDAALPDPDGVRDAVEVDPPVPLVPVTPPVSPRCRHPTTVIVLSRDDFAPVWSGPSVAGGCVCAAASAPHANPIATIAPTRFI
jgi:hypothetical protein